MTCRNTLTGQLCRWKLVVVAAIACACPSNALLAAEAGPTPQILTQDVDLFYRIYDAAGGHPSADQLQHDYLDAGTEGLHQFARMRNLTGERIADAVAKHRQDYAGARTSVAALPAVRKRLTVALRKLRELYPEAKYTPITILIGRDATVGITSETGVQIDLESMYRINVMGPRIEDRLVHTIAHEFGHVQQPTGVTFDTDPQTTVLLASELEGGAEFIAELISGSVANTQLLLWTKGHEREIETRFRADEDKRDMSAWLYNHGPGTPEKPGDLGYWVGYRITKAYYQNAADKRAALRDIIQVQDIPQAKALLAKSGWYPGIVLR
jgi:hypothetical protein